MSEASLEGRGLDFGLLNALRLTSVQFIELLIQHGTSLYRLKSLVKIDDLYENAKENETDLSNIYGILDDTIENKAENFSGQVLFNSVDMIRTNGYINSVSINFHEAPTSVKPQIWLFILSATKNSTQFTITLQYQIPSEDIKPLAGIQNFHLGTSLFTSNEQFLAIGFGENTGNIYSIHDRNQYSVELRNILNKQEKNTPVDFNNEQSQGIAFSFSIIRPSVASKIYRSAADLSLLAEDTKKFQEKEKQFDEHAAHIIDQCFEEDEDFGIQ
ncbi:unnamed protein product, partial [Didymodactylos carnosus]